ncbi:Uncharacterised protein [Klebsiella pneumoniae]|uniref:Uncharacterized protein n=1 Tax=Klebsiella pneumoniae TaxID=573 RepID=A0A377WG26_KLEPN|nr:Uncharacterised protein [Klebsiella pneumoniae]
MPSPVTTTRRLDTFVLQGGKIDSCGTKKKIKLRRSNDRLEMFTYAWWPLM